MPASPDFSGWNCVAESGPFSTAARNGCAVVAPRERGLREGRLHVEQPLLRARTSARSRSARPRCRGTAASPRPASTVFHPMCGSTGASSSVTTPGHSPRPSVSTPRSTPRSNSTCMPTQMPSTGPPAREPPVDDLVAATRAQRLHDGAERADARARRGRRPRRPAPRSAVSRASAPAAAERLDRGVDVARAVVEDRDERAVRSQRALRARDALHERVERLRLAERARERLVLGLGDVVRVAPREHA